MIFDVPPAKLSILTTRWNAYQAAILNGSTTLIATCLSVLMITLNQCSTILGQPTTPAPYTEPVPAVITVDGVLKLEYPA
jgi:hypothetical protein